MSDSELMVSIASTMSSTELSRQIEGIRPKLKRMVEYRLHPQLRGRIDGSDVVQEALMDAVRKLHDKRDFPEMTFQGWLRRITWLKMAELHRKHLGTALRDASLEVPFYDGMLPSVGSCVLASQILESGLTPSKQLTRQEEMEKLQQLIGSMNPFDRELLLMKHFEELSLTEISELLEIPRSTVGRKYLTALTTLRNLMRAAQGGDSFS